MGEKLSGPFEVSRSSDGTSHWFSARDPAAGVSIRAKDHADALSMVSALNACVAHHVTPRAPADLRSALEALELADATLRGANMNRNVVERKVVAAIELLRAAPAATPATGKAKWRERWYGSDPQKGSAITDEHGNLIAYFGGDEATHAAVTKAVIAHNSALAPLPLATETGIPDGWALVPVEPTEAMKAAGLKVVLRYDDAVASWSAMLAAALAPTKGDAS